MKKAETERGGSMTGEGGEWMGREDLDDGTTDQAMADKTFIIYDRVFLRYLEENSVFQSLTS